MSWEPSRGSRLVRLPGMSEQAAPDFPPDGRIPPIAHGSVYLRPGERRDVDLVVSWMNDLRTTRALLIVSPISEVMEARWFDEMVEHHGRDRFFFVICTPGPTAAAPG